MHDGPARLGKYSGIDTPAIIDVEKSLKVLQDEPMPYNVPKKLASWSVNRTVENARLSDENGVGVVHGSRYPDLRVQCAGNWKILAIRF